MSHLPESSVLLYELLSSMQESNPTAKTRFRSLFEKLSPMETQIYLTNLKVLMSSHPLLELRATEKAYHEAMEMINDILRKTASKKNT